MRLLLEHDADPFITTFQGTSALMAAAGVNWVYYQTYTEGPEQLLAAVNLCAELGMDVNQVNSMGRDALHGAANRGSIDIIEYLVEKGARLDVLDKKDAHRGIGRTACSSRHIRLNRNQPRSSVLQCWCRSLVRRSGRYAFNQHRRCRFSRSC